MKNIISTIVGKSQRKIEILCRNHSQYEILWAKPPEYREDISYVVSRPHRLAPWVTTHVKRMPCDWEHCDPADPYAFLFEGRVSRCSKDFVGFSEHISDRGNGFSEIIRVTEVGDEDVAELLKEV